MFGQDDMNNMGEFFDTFPNDGKYILRVYNPLEGPTLCMGKTRFLIPIF